MRLKMGGKSLKEVLKTPEGDKVKARLAEKHKLNVTSKTEMLDGLFGEGKWKERSDEPVKAKPAKTVVDTPVKEVPSVEDLKTKFTVKELKNKLKEIGLSIRGKEETLAKRLRKYLLGE